MASPFNDRIEVRGLVVTTVVGVLPHERTIAQPLQIDLDLHVDLRDAGRTDDLSDTADYGDVAERVASVVRESKDTLLDAHSHGRPVAVHAVTRAALAFAVAAWGEAGSRRGDRVEHGAVVPPGSAWRSSRGLFRAAGVIRGRLIE